MKWRERERKCEMEIDDVLFRRPGVAPPHLSTAAPVLCSQQPNRTDTPSPRVTPLWGVCVCVCVCPLVLPQDRRGVLGQFVCQREE